MQLHVAVPGGVLQPVRHRQVGLVPLAGLPAVDPGAVGAGAGVARPPAGSSRTRRARPARSCRRPRRPGRTSTRRRRGRRPGGPGGRSRPGRRGRSRCDLDSDRVRSKNSGLCRAFLTASVRSSRLRSAVACGSAASSCAYRSAALRPLSGGLAELGAVGGLALAEQQVVRLALDRWPGSKPRAFAPGPHQRPGGSPPLSLAWM